ncbi:MAG: aminotransferase class III-fold pyridoxal phosphate-dependent enzyme, partial [Myxococcota bacterium]
RPKTANVAPSDSAESDGEAKPVIAKTPIRSSGADPITPKQRARLDALVRRYTDRTRQSKESTQKHRKRLADPRAVSGFRPMLKELVYPVVVQRSKGPRVWDIDNNEYIDVLNGFGMNYFGWSPDFINQAVIEQLETGIEIGPQTPLAGEVAELFCELTGMQRVAFANTGTEAVMGAMRLARTVTGKSKIAIFAGAYHGNIDEVLVRGTRKLKTIPAAPGIPRSACDNMLVLDYGTDESLEVLKSHAHELAAVMVEPVQSRQPDLQPRAFLEQVRTLTDECGAALIFDEVITGFRVGPGGAQEYFGIRADLATYGKVVGGGLPVAMIAGAPRFMDALDGGEWQFGDDSKPEVGVTYLAGTFVRHPMALAACRAVLTRLRDEGPKLQERMNARTEKFARELNDELKQLGAPISVNHFASWWKPTFEGDHPFSDIFAVLVRDRGVHYVQGYPCFWTTSHSEDEIEKVKRVFVDAAREMLDSEFLPRNPDATNSLDPSNPPVAGARLGRDPSGKPAWFVPNPDQPGKYMQVVTEK